MAYSKNKGKTFNKIDKYFDKEYRKNANNENLKHTIRQESESTKYRKVKDIDAELKAILKQESTIILGDDKEKIELIKKVLKTLEDKKIKYTTETKAKAETFLNYYTFYIYISKEQNEEIVTKKELKNTLNILPHFDLFTEIKEKSDKIIIGIPFCTQTYRGTIRQLNMIKQDEKQKGTKEINSYNYYSHKTKKYKKISDETFDYLKNKYEEKAKKLNYNTTFGKFEKQMKDEFDGYINKYFRPEEIKTKDIANSSVVEIEVTYDRLKELNKQNKEIIADFGPKVVAGTGNESLRYSKNFIQDSHPNLIFIYTNKFFSDRNKNKRLKNFNY